HAHLRQGHRADPDRPRPLQPEHRRQAAVRRAEDDGAGILPHQRRFHPDQGRDPGPGVPKNGDAKDFGESTYDNALPWTHIAPADYKPEGDLKGYLPQLESLHAARAAKSPSWKLMLDELAQYKTMRAKTTVSLNFAKREAERKQL